MALEYDNLIRDSYGYSQKEQDSSPAWATVRELYAKNFVGCTDFTPKIPKKIHQIWLGSKLPEKYIRLTDTWQDKNPTWEYRLWTDRDVDCINMTKRDVFNSCRNNGMKSDILRYEILRNEGGLYVDSDFECLKSFDDLVHLEFFTGISYDAEMVLYNGLIATVPEHPIINECVNNINKGYEGNDAMTIMGLTGPYYFTKQFVGSVNKDTKGVVAFPPGYFYPLPNNMRCESNPYRFVKPYSFAIHHWAVDWIKHK